LSWQAPFEGGRHPEAAARSAALEGRPPPQGREKSGPASRPEHGGK
jgi:hypothetical protein